MNAPLKPVPPLENGDHLSRDEFERRYAGMPNLKKAELIEGVVYMPSPVKVEGHGRQHADLMTLLGLYRVFTEGVYLADNSTIRLDTANEPQPDGVLFIDSQRGGRAVVDDEGYLTGGPELAAEIASSSVSIDLGVKKRVYRSNGVREYIVWRVLDESLDWFVLRRSRYHELGADRAGVVRSDVFPGLWLDVPALLRGDLLRAHDCLCRGLESAQHGAFVKRLADAKPR
jgi:Putative restriction endonuclease